MKFCLACCCLLCVTGGAVAQHAGHEAAAGPAPSLHEHAGPEALMRGMYGPYGMTRESSGTAWQPEATPMEGVHLVHGDWLFMFHGFANVVYTHQGGKRGDDDVYGTNMFMAMASRPIGAGTLGLRSMLSLEPLTVGRGGYAELLQTGETGDGRTPLIDRQHPHDLFMELAASYSVPVGGAGSAFVYFGWPGEPALGPPTFMHRFSGIDNPEAPLTHHWLDATHITQGVATLGGTWREFKIDSSIFTGREPDQHRWDLEEARFDSWSVRLSWNPTPQWSAQVSYGDLNSPEQLEPDVDTQRTTASLIYTRSWGETVWQSTLAWGRNNNDPGRTLDGVLVESALRWRDRHTFLGRWESVEKDELFGEGHPRHGRRFLVHKASLGYIYDFAKWGHLRAGVGALGSVHFMPNSLESFYGDTPGSFLVFVRVKM